MLNDIYADAQERMDKALERLERSRILSAPGALSGHERAESPDFLQEHLLQRGSIRRESDEERFRQ